jgi:hypothetical protein
MGPADVGFLLMKGIDLILAETHWLLSLLQLTHGPSSPHLRALHAVLKVSAQARRRVADFSLGSV